MGDSNDSNNTDNNKRKHFKVNYSKNSIDNSSKDHSTVLIYSVIVGLFGSYYFFNKM